MTRNELIERATRALLGRKKTTGPARKVLAAALEAYIHTITQALSEGEPVKIRKLGVFRVQPTAGSEYPRVVFRAGPTLRRKIVEKYGVKTNDDKVKTAQKGKQCPKCGSRDVDWSANVPRCPNCGTEPWEATR